MANDTFPLTSPAPETVGNMEQIEFNHRVALGAAGVLAATGNDLAARTGIVVTKTAAKTGRYTIRMANGRKFRQFRGGWVSIVGLDDATWGANTTGARYFWRDDDTAVDGTIELQFVRNTDNADAELPDNYSFVLDFKALVR